jgi:hypothetical protein
MKTKFGSIIVAGSGKIGGHVASKNRAGSYLRTKVTPANAQTAFQVAVRGRFSTLAQAWRGLTQAQRDAWNAAVGAFSRTDIFGDLRNPSGINLFQRLNNVLVNVGQAPMNLPPLPSEVPAVVLSAFTFAVGVPAMSAEFDGPVPADTSVIVMATAPLSAGKNNVTSQYRQIGVIAPASASPFNLLALYTAKFGGVGVVGQKIFIKFVPVNELTGQQGGTSVMSAISVA